MNQSPTTAIGSQAIRMSEPQRDDDEENAERDPQEAEPECADLPPEM